MDHMAYSYWILNQLDVRLAGQAGSCGTFQTLEKNLENIIQIIINLSIPNLSNRSSKNVKYFFKMEKIL